VATRVAAALGQSVERLVLVAPAGLGPELDQGFVDGMLAVRTPVDLRRELDRLGPDPTAMSQSWLDDQVDRLVRRRDPLAALAAAIVRDGRQRIDITADVDVLACPVTAVFGLADTVVPWQHATRLPARAAIHFVRDAGHMPHRAAADLVAALVDG
jgi:pyruvate dehydrogenase E2 component (dihydrolipoamide acetyltransferase)